METLISKISLSILIGIAIFKIVQFLVHSFTKADVSKNKYNPKIFLRKFLNPDPVNHDNKYVYSDCPYYDKCINSKKSRNNPQDFSDEMIGI